MNTRSQSFNKGYTMWSVCIRWQEKMYHIKELANKLSVFSRFASPVSVCVCVCVGWCRNGEGSRQRALSSTGSILSNTDLSDLSTVGTCDIFNYQMRHRVM